MGDMENSMSAFGRRWHLRLGDGPWSHGIRPSYGLNMGGGHTLGWWQIQVWTTYAAVMDAPLPTAS